MSVHMATCPCAIFSHVLTCTAAQREYRLPSTGEFESQHNSGRSLQRRLNSAQQLEAASQCWGLARTAEEQALMRSRAVPGFGAFLLACPADRAMAMSDRQLQVAVHTHLGIPYLQPRLLDCTQNDAFHPRCPCHPDQEPTDGHVMGCKKFDRITPHNIIRDHISAMLQSTAVTTRLEQQIDGQRRTDVTACHFQPDGKDLHLITSALATSYLAQAAKTPLHAATTRCARKDKKYKDAVEALGADFMPLVIAASGAFHGNVGKLIELTSLRVSNVKPEQATRLSPCFVSYWVQRLSVRLHAAIADKLLRALDTLQRNARAARGFIIHFQGV